MHVKQLPSFLIHKVVYTTEFNITSKIKRLNELLIYDYSISQASIPQKGVLMKCDEWYYIFCWIYLGFNDSIGMCYRVTHTYESFTKNMNIRYLLDSFKAMS